MCNFFKKAPQRYYFLRTQPNKKHKIRPLFAQYGGFCAILIASRGLELAVHEQVEGVF